MDDSPWMAVLATWSRRPFLVKFVNGGAIVAYEGGEPLVIAGQAQEGGISFFQRGVRNEFMA